MRTAVVVSILAHASLLAAAGLRKPASVPDELAPPTDVWAGTTSLPTGSEELVDVDTMGGSSRETPPTPAPAPAAPSGDDSADDAPVEPPNDPPKAPVVPDKQVGPDKPAPKDPPKTPETPKPQPAPDKTEKPRPKPEPADDKTPEPAPEKPAADDKPAKPEEQAPDSSDKPADQDKPVAKDEPSPEPEKKPAKTAKRPKATPPPAAAPANADGSADGTGKSAGSGSFGAEGTAVVRDLGKAFTRALPAASSADKTWGALAAGSSGTIEVAVAIGEEGKITGYEVLSKDPPAFLLSAVKRTVDMLKFGSFVRPGETATAGRNVFRLIAEVSDRSVTEDDVSGAAAFGLGSTWEGRKGTAHFTQASGKHVEMTVEFVRALPAKE
jgi:outer membrane biosynthesis protein TonB